MAYFFGVKVGVANFFVGQSIGIDETNGVKVGVENFFDQSIGTDETNTFQSTFCSRIPFYSTSNGYKTLLLYE